MHVKRTFLFSPIFASYNNDAPYQNTIFCSGLSAQYVCAHLHPCGGYRLLLWLSRPVLFSEPEETPVLSQRRSLREPTEHQQLPVVSKIIANHAWTVTLLALHWWTILRLQHIHGLYFLVLFNFSRIPDDSTSDMSSPSSTEESTGLFMLRKDSERRATLHRVLTEHISNVVSSIQQSVPQVGKEKSQQVRGNDELNSVKCIQFELLGMHAHHSLC